MDTTVLIIAAVVLAVVGFAVSYFIGNKLVGQKISEAEQNAKLLLKDAENEAVNLKKEKLLEVKEEWHKKKQEFENDTQQRKLKMQQAEKDLKSKQEAVDSKNDQIQKKEKALNSFDEELKKKETLLKTKLEEAEAAYNKQLSTLEKISGMSKEEAKKSLMDSFINEAKQTAAAQVKFIRDEAKLSASKDARNIILDAIQRTASDHSVDTTVSVVNLNSDEMKGRIIGREGRNIRAFESATGIDLIIDDTPEALVISSFDPYRREIARVTLEYLIKDGRIHPTRIEELYDKTSKDINVKVREYGEAAMFELGISKMDAELIELIGKLHFRTSYGQNVLQHSIEVATLAGLMAAEMGENEVLAKRAGLLHDIGKAIDHEIEGSHVTLGRDLALKFKENEIVVNAIESHHGDTEATNVISALVAIADTLSASRPGARNDSLENYVKRLQDLENIANSMDGVDKTYAVQAGREIRVIVKPEQIDDLGSYKIARDIKERIENEMQYPGTIKVTVIRETRATEEAK